MACVYHALYSVQRFWLLLHRQVSPRLSTGADSLGGAGRKVYQRVLIVAQTSQYGRDRHPLPTRRVLHQSYRNSCRRESYSRAHSPTLSSFRRQARIYTRPTSSVVVVAEPKRPRFTRASVAMINVSETSKYLDTRSSTIFTKSLSDSVCR